MPPFVIELSWNDVTLDELAGHGLTLDDAHVALAIRPKFFQNRGNRERLRRGLPRRWMMIGPGADGRLLTFIVEDPNEERVSHLVTGWPSNVAQETRYAQPGGKLNRP